MAQIFLGAASVLLPALAGAQTPWAVTLTPTLDPSPIGLCAAIHLTVLDATGMITEWNNTFGLAGSFATTPEASAPGKTQASQENKQMEQLEQPIRARPGESTIAVPLVDDSTPNLRGSYILYLRVERVP